MNHIIKFDKFLLESFLPNDKKKAIDIIISYLNQDDINFYEYEEIWHIQKNNLFLSGKLFISLKSCRAIRFNWIENDIKNNLHSIDLWEDFKFDTKPDFTLEIKDSTIDKILPQISNFIKNPSVKIIENTEGKYDPKAELEEAEKRLPRLRSQKSIDAQKQKISRLKASIAWDEKSSTDSEQVNQLDEELKINVFKSIELYTIQVANGKSNSLIITGLPGLGKTQTVIDTLSELGLAEDKDYFMATGTITTAGLYAILFKLKDKLIVFDDCDAVFKEADSINMLKGALDTYKIRKISKLTQGNTFNAIGLTDEEIETEYNNTGKLPNKFAFTGQIIFISNLPEDKFDKAVLSRSLHVDVNLNREELMERMTEIMRKLCVDVDESKKNEALDYLNYITNAYPTKFDMSIRTLIHCINIRANNEGTIKIGDKEEYAWKLLIKKYLIKSKK